VFSLEHEETAIVQYVKNKSYFAQGLTTVSDYHVVFTKSKTVITRIVIINI